jgi:hypothetical protein
VERGTEIMDDVGVVVGKGDMGVVVGKGDIGTMVGLWRWRGGPVCLWSLVRQDNEQERGENEWRGEVLDLGGDKIPCGAYP